MNFDEQKLVHVCNLLDKIGGLKKYFSWSFFGYFNFSQLFHEFEVLQEENQQLLSMTSDLKAQLEESGGQTAALRSSLDKYTILDSQYQR